MESKRNAFYESHRAELTLFYTARRILKERFPGTKNYSALRKPLLVKREKLLKEIAKTASICAWNTDMYGVNPTKDGAGEYYDSLFELYASWGVDFVKCDDIARELPHEEEELIMLSKALNNCGRDMILSLSPGPALLEKAELYDKVSGIELWSGDKVEFEKKLSFKIKSHGAKVYYCELICNDLLSSVFSGNHHKLIFSCF